LEEVAVCAGHKVLAAADSSSVLIVMDPQRISGQLLKFCSIHLLNLIIRSFIIY